MGVSSLSTLSTSSLTKENSVKNNSSISKCLVVKKPVDNVDSVASERES